MNEKPASTYVTPKSPRQACLNALSEIEARGITDHREQAEVIIHHLHDYQGGKLTVAVLKKMAVDEILKFVFDWDKDERSTS